MCLQTTCGGAAMSESTVAIGVASTVGADPSTVAGVLVAVEAKVIAGMVGCS